MNPRAWIARGVARLRGLASAPFGLGSIFTSGGEPPVRGTQDLLEAYETMPWLRTVASKVAVAVADTEWQLFTVREDGRAVRRAGLQRAVLSSRRRQAQTLARAGQLREEVDHVFFGALSRPNPLMSQAGLLRITQVALDLIGDAYWLKDRNALGAVAGFWPIPPHWVREHPSPTRDTFRVSWAGWQRDIPRGEVVWFHDPSPSQPYGRGSGIGWALLDELEVDEYVAKMAKVVFFNRARPEFVLSAEGVDEVELRRLKREWLAEHQGFWKAGKGHFLAGKASIHEFQQQTIGQQIMYPQLRTAQRDVIFQGWGVPPEIFGVLENANRATIDAALYHWLLLTIVPRIELMRGTLQVQVVEEYDQRLVLDYAERIPADQTQALNVRRAAPWAWNADEWRAHAGDQPMEDVAQGQVRLIPLNSYLTSSLLDDTRRPQGGGAGDGGGSSELAALEARIARLEGNS